MKSLLLLQLALLEDQSVRVKLYAHGKYWDEKNYLICFPVNYMDTKLKISISMWSSLSDQRKQLLLNGWIYGRKYLTTSSQNHIPNWSAMKPGDTQNPAQNLYKISQVSSFLLPLRIRISICLPTLPTVPTIWASLEWRAVKIWFSIAAASRTLNIWRFSIHAAFLCCLPHFFLKIIFWALLAQK